MANNNPLSPGTLRYLQRAKLNRRLEIPQTVSLSELEMHSYLFTPRWTPAELRALAADIGGEFQAGLDYKNSLEGEMALKAAAMRELASRIEAREQYQYQRQCLAQYYISEETTIVYSLDVENREEYQPLEPLAGSSSDGANSQSAPAVVKRGRGRPRKHPIALSTSEKANSDEKQPPVLAPPKKMKRVEKRPEVLSPSKKASRAEKHPEVLTPHKNANRVEKHRKEPKVFGTIEVKWRI